MRYGLIAGNGRFPLLALETARREGHEVVVVAIENEAAPELAQYAAAFHWINIGQLSKLIAIFQREKIAEVMMTGQVRHVSLFSGITPDWRLVKLLASLKEKNTAALIGGIQQVLAKRASNCVDSTRLLKPLLAPKASSPGASQVKKKKPTSLRPPGSQRAGRLRHRPERRHLRKSLRRRGSHGRHRRHAAPRRFAGRTADPALVKASRGREHLLFDVPVAGLNTIEMMLETRTTVLAVDAGRTLLLDEKK